MMGRSESRDGWRAMSATRKVGNRDFLRCCGREPDRWAVVVFPCSEDGQIRRDRLWLGRAKPHCREKASSRTTLARGQVAGRNSLLLQMERVSRKRRKKASARKTGLKHGCAAAGKLVSRWDSDDSGGPKRREWVTAVVGRESRRRQRRKRSNQMVYLKRRFRAKGSAGARTRRGVIGDLLQGAVLVG